RILTPNAFANAIRTNAAIGGSTNAVLHLIALTGRIGVELRLEDWDRLGRDVPTVVDLMPSGRFLMEDFYYTDGLPVVLKARPEAGLLCKDEITANGRTIWQNIADAENYNPEVIRSLSQPLMQSGGIAVLRGNLAPGSAVLKPSAATPSLMQN